MSTLLKNMLAFSHIFDSRAWADPVVSMGCQRDHRPAAPGGRGGSTRRRVKHRQGIDEVVRAQPAPGYCVHLRRAGV